VSIIEIERKSTARKQFEVLATNRQISSWRRRLRQRLIDYMSRKNSRRNRRLRPEERFDRAEGRKDGAKASEDRAVDRAHQTEVNCRTSRPIRRVEAQEIKLTRPLEALVDELIKGDAVRAERRENDAG